MSTRLIFHGNLANLLIWDKHGVDAVRTIDRSAPVKDLVESQGIPHTEVGTVLSGDLERPFSHTPLPFETLDIHPHCPPVDPTSPSILFPEPLQGISFVVDVNVGRLARLLRLTGFDSLYVPEWSDQRIAEAAEDDGRILLTRDRELLKRKRVKWGRLIRSSSPWQQLAEVIIFFGLNEKVRLFSRCPGCNSLLVHADMDEVIDQLEPLTRLMYNKFTRCPACGQAYWAGSHHQKILEKLEATLQQGSQV